jgi:hypothetical protein
MPTLLEEAHGIACFQEMSQGHTVYNSKQNFNRQRQMRINPKLTSRLVWQDMCHRPVKV